MMGVVIICVFLLLFIEKLCIIVEYFDFYVVYKFVLWLIYLVWVWVDVLDLLIFM